MNWRKAMAASAMLRTYGVPESPEAATALSEPWRMLLPGALSEMAEEPSTNVRVPAVRPQSQVLLSRQTYYAVKARLSREE